MMLFPVVLLAVLLIAFWMLRPVYVRWRDYLQHAPELQDASFGTKVLVLFKGLRTKVFARFMDGLGVALPAINAIGGFFGSGGIDLTGVLPDIPLGGDAKMSAVQYSPLILLMIGRMTDYLRSISTTAPNTIDPALAATVAGNSNNVAGSTPSPALAAVVDPTAPVPASAPAPARRKPRRRKATRRKSVKRKPARKKAA